MTETNDSQVDRNCMGSFGLLDYPLTYSPEGRFIIWNSISYLTVVDVFHTKKKATVGETPLKTNGEDVSFKSTWAFDLNAILLLFTVNDHTYVGLGEVDLNRSRMFIKQTVPLTVNFRHNHSNWFPLSHPPNLYDGVILTVYDSSDNYAFFTVKMGTNNDVEVSQLNVPMRTRAVGCLDGILYGLVYNDTARQINHRQQIDLVKYSISSGTHVQEPTVNWEIVDDAILMNLATTENRFCYVGRRVFVADLWNDKYRIISLDLDTKKWLRTSFEFPRLSISMHSDYERTLFVSTYSNKALISRIHRFVYNQPDTLSDLVWLQLKRIFDARDSSYEFILSQLPKNFKQKCPF